MTMQAERAPSQWVLSDEAEKGLVKGYEKDIIRASHLKSATSRRARTVRGYGYIEPIVLDSIERDVPFAEYSEMLHASRAMHFDYAAALPATEKALAETRVPPASVDEARTNSQSDSSHINVEWRARDAVVALVVLLFAMVVILVASYFATGLGLGYTWPLALILFLVGVPLVISWGLRRQG